MEATQDYEPYDRQKNIDANRKNTARHAYFREYLTDERLRDFSRKSVRKIVQKVRTKRPLYRQHSIGYNIIY